MIDTSISDPTFLGLVEAVRTGDDGAALVLCDWLEEHGATTADVLALYALPPPPHVLLEGQRPDGWWQMATGISPAEDDSLRPVLMAWCWTREPEYSRPGCKDKRWQEVMQVRLVSHATFARSFAYAELKRQVLRLFPEVKFAATRKDKS